MLNDKSLIQNTIELIRQSKFNLVVREYPADSLETLFYHLLDPASEKKYELLEKYLLIKGIDEYIHHIFSIEIGITRKSFLNWLANKDCNYEQWMPLVNYFLSEGYTEIFELIKTIIKSPHTDPNSRDKVAVSMLEYSNENDWQYLISHPLPSDFSSEPKLNTKSRKLRVAFLSPKFATHVLSSQTVFQDIIFSGATNDFEIYLFALKHHPDEYTEIYRKRADQYIDLSSLSDSESQDIIQKAQIDIVVDLLGATPVKYWKLFESSIRVGIFCARSFVKNYYHYLLGTKDLFPAWQRNFTKLLPLENDYFLPTLPPVEINSELPSATNKYVNFGCFSRDLKINRINFDTWATLLNETPNSRIHFSFINLTKPKKIKIIKEFRYRGIDASRIFFFDQTDPIDHLKKYNMIDVVIDSFPTGSGFSGGDALWMGVPIVGLSKESDTIKTSIFSLKQVDKEKWLTKNEREYIDLCKELVFDEAYRKSLKLTLRQDVINSDLQNGKKYSQELYRCIRGLAPKI